MIAVPFERWIDTAGSDSDSLLHHRFLEPPYGYVLGAVLWPVFLSVVAVWATMIQTGLPEIVVTVGGLVVGIGGFVATSASTALVMGLTAWNTPEERIRRQFALLSLSLLLAVLLIGVYLHWPTIPYRDELGLSVFAAHELSKIGFLGPAIGCAFTILPLVVLARRGALK